ncbi:SUKH-4 family immunity protein [Kitasatospora sp. NPDC001159]
MVEADVEVAGLKESPDGLTHGRSRELLAAGELCWSYAHLDLRDSGADALESASTWWEGRAVQGAEGLYVLGEARYETWSIRGPVAVLLDGASGEVYLARPDDDGVLQRDLLASSPDTLIALVAAIEAVTSAAAGEYDLDEGGAEPPRRPATVTEVVRVVREELREADPELFRRTDGQPAHWETALRIRALGWGAESGEDGALAYEIDPSLVEDLATIEGEGVVRRFAEDELPERLTHAPTRHLLTEIGLPVSGRCLLDVDAEGPLGTLAEGSPENYEPDEDGDMSSRPYQGEFLVVGGWMYDFVVALDGATGQVELPDWWDDDDPAAYLHRDLSALLYVLWTFEHLRAQRREAERPQTSGSWSVFDPCELLDGAAEETLRALDPEAFASDRHFWPIRVDDGHMGSLLE